MIFFGLPGKYRTRAIGIPAYGDDRVYPAIQKFIQRLGGMAGDINADLLHDLNRHWVDLARWVGTRTGDFNRSAYRRT